MVYYCNQLYKLALFKYTKKLDIDIINYIVGEFIRVNIVVLRRKKFVKITPSDKLNNLGYTYSKMMHFLKHNHKIIY